MSTHAESPPSLFQRAVWAAEEELGERNPKLWFVLRLMGFLPPFTFSRLRMRLLRMIGVAIGNDTVVCGSMSIAGSRHAQRALRIGSSCVINEGCRFETGARIHLGDRVYVGHDVTMLTTTHEIGGHDQRCHARVTAPVTVGDGVWIGARSLILPGVTIGAGAVVAAGAVVTESVPPDTLVGGVPARRLRTLD